MTGFSRIDTTFDGAGSVPSFTYTDIDDDRLEAYAHPNGTLRLVCFNVNGGIAIAAEDIAEFKKQIARIARRKCPGCNGEGYVDV